VQKPRCRHWPEAIAGVLGALPLVVIWLHVYSHTPAWHSEPTWSHTVALVVVAVVAAVASGRLLRARLRMPWLAAVAVALIAPVIVVASGVVRARSAAFGDETAPVVGALGAAAAFLLGAVLIASVPLRSRVIALLLPLGLALAIGHVVYGLPGRTRYDIASRIGHPWPNEAASNLLYGHVLSD
jgi:hypothetical protein